MNSVLYKLLHHKFTLLGTIFAILIVVLTIWHFIPQSIESKQNSSAVIMECEYTELQADGKSVFHLHPDTMYIKAAWINRFSTIPSCFGQLIAYNDVKEHDEAALSSDSLHQLVKIGIDSISHRLDSISTVESELTYYLRVHGVQDEGFMMVSQFSQKVINRIDTLKKKLTALKQIKANQKLSFKRRRTYFVYYIDENGQVKNEKCHATKDDRDGKYRFYQTESSHTPHDVSVLRRSAFFKDIDEMVYVKRFGANGQKAICRIHPFYDIPVEKGHTNDNGIFRMINGHLVSGKWNKDTIYNGIRKDSTGLYIGDLNRKGEANGKGIYIDKGPSYYEGFFSNDMRNGYGFSIAPNKALRAGEWKNDRYKGERVHYTADRIYGIDVSRYQHESGRKRYSIDWSKVRISGLGKLSKKTISGQVDYPISFVYLKSTEGTSVFNKYYAADYKQAKANGIKVGTYHFFSTTTKASQQAAFFLKKSKLQKGDFPPVLDVEPFPSQIQKMGGILELWSRVRLWLHTVEKASGVKPVLYISQTFVNKYLNAAPDIKRDYKIWIARYGEYKPDVRLVYWQLAPDGRVRGIHGEVDINVFNGYRSEYQEFLRNELIK